MKQNLDAKCKNNTYFFDLILNEIVYKELIIKSSMYISISFNC